MAERFQIATTHSGRRRTIRVVVYDDVRQLRHEGTRYARRYMPTAIEGMEKTWGLCQAFDLRDVSAKGRVQRLPSAGIIRLSRRALGTGLIAHEAAHMALAIYQQDIQRTIPDMECEEKLCYLVGDISRQIVDGLYQRRILQKVRAGG